MSCGLYRSGLIELARGGPSDHGVATHLEVCEGCKAFLAAQRRLSVAVRGVAATVASAPLPKGLESELLAEFDAVRRVAPRPRAFWFTAGAFALTAAAMFAVVTLRMPGVIPAKKLQPIAAIAKPSAGVEKSLPEQPVVSALRPVTMPPRRPLRNRLVPNTAQAETQEAAFVSIPYTAPLAPNERADVVRMDVPVAALIAAGLPMRVHDMGASASADVLVGEDGRARAVRLISLADSRFNRSFR